MCVCVCVCPSRRFIGGVSPEHFSTYTYCSRTSPSLFLICSDVWLVRCIACHKQSGHQQLGISASGQFLLSFLEHSPNIESVATDGRQSRSMACLDVSIGALPQHPKAMGMDMEVIGAADSKATARAFIKAEHPNVPHIWHSNDAYLDGHGQCSLHEGTCHTSSASPDIACGGLPCQPFSRLRVGSRSSDSSGGKGAAVGRTGGPTTHPDYGTVFQFEQYLIARKPSSFLVEEVMEFNNMNPATGKTFLFEFAAFATAQGYAVRAFVLDHSVWCELPRQRLWVIGIGECAGGSLAADWCVRHIQARLVMNRACCSDPSSWRFETRHEPRARANSRGSHSGTALSHVFIAVPSVAGISLDLEPIPLKHKDNEDIHKAYARTSERWPPPPRSSRI